MSDLRKKYKGANLKKQQTYLKEKTDESYTNTGGRPGYIDIAPGKNILRIAPPHDPDNPAMEAKYTSWIPVEVKDDSGSIEIKVKPFFNARVHGGQKVDIVEKYIEVARDIVEAKHGKNTKAIKKDLAPIYGYRDRNGKWHSGISPSLMFVAYGWLGDEFGRINLRKTIVDRMNELTIDEESDEPISVDPFSDPENGYNLIIVYSPDEDDRNKRYRVNRGSKPKPLTDEQLEQLDAVIPLIDMFRNQYHKETFDKVIAGLKMFDDENGYGVFDMEDFIEFAEQVREELPNPPDDSKADEDEDDAAPIKSSGKKEIKKSVKTDKTIIEFVEDALDAIDDHESLAKFVSDININYDVDKDVRLSRCKREIIDIVEESGASMDDLGLGSSDDDKEEDAPKPKSSRNVRPSKDEKFLKDLHEDNYDDEKNDDDPDSSNNDKLAAMRAKLKNMKKK